MVDPYELAPDGHKIGKDPRKMTREEFSELGHVPMSALDAIRARCQDCCGGEAIEVRKCPAVACPSWPFRMGRSPWKEVRKMSEEAKAKAVAHLKTIRAARS